MINSVQDIINGSTNTNTPLDSLMERVQALELTQSLQAYPSQNQLEGSNPMNPDTQRADLKSRPPSPSLSESDDKESSIAQPGNRDDLAAVLQEPLISTSAILLPTASRAVIYSMCAN